MRERLPIPKTLGSTLYIQPIEVQQELKIRLPGMILRLVVVVFGLVMGALGVYAWFLYNKDHYLLIGIGVLALFGWLLWEHLHHLTRVRIGFVCEKGVGYCLLNSRGRVLKTVSWAFSPATRMLEYQGRTGPIANMRDYWELSFREEGCRTYRITFQDFGRDGYGHAETDDPDKMEYLFARESFLAYQHKDHGCD